MGTSETCQNRLTGGSVRYAGKKKPLCEGIGPVASHKLPSALPGSRGRRRRTPFRMPHRLGDEEFPHPDGGFYEEEKSDADEDHFGDCGLRFSGGYVAQRTTAALTQQSVI